MCEHALISVYASPLEADGWTPRRVGATGHITYPVQHGHAPGDVRVVSAISDDLFSAVQCNKVRSAGVNSIIIIR